jgi:hypothetical protein
VLRVLIVIQWDLLGLYSTFNHSAARAYVSVCIRFLRNAGAVKAKNNRVAPCAPVMSHFHSHKGAALLGPARRMCVCNIIDRILSWIAYTFLLSEHIQAPFYYCWETIYVPGACITHTLTRSHSNIHNPVHIALRYIAVRSKCVHLAEIKISPDESKGSRWILLM